MSVVRFRKELLEEFGEDVSEVLNELGFPTEYDEGNVVVEITPDRPELLSYWGIRALLNSVLKGKREGRVEVKDSGYKIRVEDVRSRPFIGALIVRGVRFNEEELELLFQFQEKLDETLGRKRKKTAIGIHDLNKIKGKELVYRVNESAVFIPLEHDNNMSIKEVVNKTKQGVKYGHLVKEYLVIEDEQGVLSFPPIINSERTKVTTNTTDVFIECTGTSAQTINQILKLFVHTFMEKGCESIESVEIVYNTNTTTTPELSNREMNLDVTHVNTLLGLQLKEEEVKDLLARTGFVYENGVVTIPYYRDDVIDDVDVVKEVVVNYGVNNVPKNSICVENEWYERASNKWENVVELFVKQGYDELMLNYITSNESNAVKIENAVSENLVSLRELDFEDVLEVMKKQNFKKVVAHVKGFFKRQDVVENDVILVAWKSAESKVNELWSDVLLGLEVLGLREQLKEANEMAEVNKLVKRLFSYTVFEGGDVVVIIGEVHPTVLEQYNITEPVALAVLWWRH